MNYVDIIIIAILFIGALVGYKRGLIPQLFSLIGFVLIVIGSFILKNPVAGFLYDKLPFFKLFGALKGVTIINILLYEVLAFIIVLSILLIIFKIIMKLSKVLEKVFAILLIYEVPSRLIGSLLGALENFIVVFIMLYIVSLPIFNFDALKQSKLREPILNKTPILNNYIDEFVDVSEELWSITEIYKKDYNANEFNLEALDILLKYDITTVESIDKLVEKDKIKINGIENILSKYRK